MPTHSTAPSAPDCAACRSAGAQEHMRSTCTVCHVHAGRAAAQLPVVSLSLTDCSLTPPSTFADFGPLLHSQTTFDACTLRRVMLGLGSSCRLAPQVDQRRSSKAYKRQQFKQQKGQTALHFFFAKRLAECVDQLFEPPRRRDLANESALKVFFPFCLTGNV